MASLPTGFFTKGRQQRDIKAAISGYQKITIILMISIIRYLYILYCEVNKKGKVGIAIADTMTKQ
jgi:hypothetical protein